MTIDEKYKKISWEKVYKKVTKEAEYKRITCGARRYDSAFWDNIPTFYNLINKVDVDALLDNVQCRIVDYKSKLKAICGTRGLTNNGTQFYQDIPNSNGKIIDREVVNELFYLLVEFFSYEYEGNDTKTKKRELKFSPKKHRSLMRSIRNKLKQLLSLIQYADIQGINDVAAANINEYINMVVLTTKYLDHIMNNYKKLTGPNKHEEANKYLLYLYLYLRFCGGYPQGQIIALIDSVIPLIREDLGDFISQELLTSRLYRVAYRYQIRRKL